MTFKYYFQMFKGARDAKIGSLYNYVAYNISPFVIFLVPQHLLLLCFHRLTHTVNTTIVTYATTRSCY